MAEMNGNASKLWIGIALGAAVGIGIALSRRKRDRWESAREVTKRIGTKSGDMAEVTRDLMARVKDIYEESCKVVEDATELWGHGRKLVGV